MRETLNLVRVIFYERPSLCSIAFCNKAHCPLSLSLSLSLSHTHTQTHTSIRTCIRIPVCVARDVDRRLGGSVETVHEDAEQDLGGVGSGWLSADGDDAEALVRILPHTRVHEFRFCLV